MAAVVLLVLAVWAVTAPYADGLVGLQVNVRAAVEVVDHVIPGLVAGAAAMALLLRPSLALGAGLVAMMAGAWMTATHVPLAAGALRGVGSMGAAAWHLAPGAAVLVLALAVVVSSIER